MADTRWLERRYQGWYAVKDVPRRLRSVVGRKRFIKSLGTRDLHVAVARRHAALAEFGRIIAAAQSRSTVDPIVEAGIAWRDTFASIDRGDAAVVDHLGGLDEAEGTASLVFYGEIDRIRDEKGHTAAKAFNDLARGLATPLLHFVDAWLIEGGIKGPLRERTQRQYRSDLVELAAWTTEAGIPPTIEAITKQAASRYVTEALLGNGIDRKTANRKISAASAYWRWLVKRTPVSINPWSRWFITHAREAGFDRAIVAAIVGQEVGNITDDLYSGGPSDGRKRECVEAVKLPPFGAISAVTWSSSAPSGPKDGR